MNPLYTYYAQYIWRLTSSAQGLLAVRSKILEPDRNIIMRQSGSVMALQPGSKLAKDPIHPVDDSTVVAGT